MQDYEVINNHIGDEEELPRDHVIYYHCLKCGGVIPSVPTDNIGCKCGNICIDLDYFRYYLEDSSLLEVLRKIKS